MDRTVAKTVRGMVAALAAAGVLVPQLAGHAASGSPVDEAVTAALTQAWGPGLVADDSTSAGCMGSAVQSVAYRADRVVLRTSLGNAAVVAAVHQALAALGSGAAVAGIERIDLPPPPSGPALIPVVVVDLARSGTEPVPVVALARRLHGSGEIVAAAPDYALSPSSGPTFMWPNGYPQPAPALTPPRAAVLGAGTNVVVYDTGLASPAQSDHPATVVRLTPQDAEAVDTRLADGIADLYYAGHGVAIAGVVATLAPSATVVETRITEANGVATDVSAARRMASTLRAADAVNAWPDVIVAAFGSPACDVNPAVPGDELTPVGLGAVMEAIDRNDESLVVGSAGNRSTSRRYYPAAFPSVVAVGALDGGADADLSPWTSSSRTGPVASFSNYGAWVDAWAPGVGLPTTHLDGVRFETNGPVLAGIASVDGTSFAGPYVAALVAERVATTGLAPDAAWVQVRSTGRACSAAAGGGVAVALRSMAASAVTTAQAGTTVAC